jgi:hypothetical protein
MSRTLVLTVLLTIWLATGIVAGFVMGYRRHDRFPWWLLGVAFGPLLVPLALGAERRGGVHRWGHTTPDGAGPIRSGPHCHRRLAASSHGADRRTRQPRRKAG